MNLTDAARRSVETGFGDAEANRFAANEDILAILDGYTHEMIKFLLELGHQIGWNYTSNAERQYIVSRMHNTGATEAGLLAELGKHRMVKLRFTMNAYNELVDLNDPKGINPGYLSMIFSIMHAGLPGKPEDAVLPDVFCLRGVRRNISYRATDDAIEVLSFN